MRASRPIRILFDAQCMVGNKTGIGNYTQRLVLALAEKPDVSLIGFYAASRHTPDLPQAPNITYQRLPTSRKILNELRRRHLLPPIELLALKHADFLLFPDFLDIPSLFKTPRAVAVHDLTYNDHPEYVANKNARDLARFVPAAIKRSDFLLTVSNFSAQRIHEIYHTPLQDIQVTPVPFEAAALLPEESVQALIDKQGLDKPFILFVGTLEPRKNLSTLVEAYSQLPGDKQQSFSLVIAGKIDWKAEAITEQINTFKQQGYDIRTLGFVDNDTRAALYQSAAAFVMPSHYEGFGMPVVEALHYGLPCLVSDIPPLHEAGGNAVEYFSPSNSQELAQKLNSLLSNPVTQRVQIESNQPTWEQISQQVYERIVQATRGSH